jgi:hypothetical protein
MALFPLSSAFAAQQHIGQVGGLSNVWQLADSALTRPANTTAYAANQAIGSNTTALFKFSGFLRANGGSALLTGLRLVASLSGIAASNMGAIRAHLFNAAPSIANGLVDQGTFNTLLADDLFKLGTVDFSTWNIGGGGSNLIESYGAPALSPLPIIGAQTPAPGARDLYVILVATGAFTPASGQTIQAYASATMD